MNEQRSSTGLPLRKLFRGQATIEPVADGWNAAPKRVRFSFQEAHAWMTPDEARELGIALISAAEELRLMEIGE